ncbi:MAG: cupin domain-containing protein [bacterium]|nr:cupin domain-containing protein [Gammaproteobacteria bacterium]HIL98967.1 cupin domain-containing protein [Pseudomonadales bacterium]
MIDTGPHRLDKVRTILSPDGAAHLKTDSPTFYADLDNEFGDFSGHMLCSQHSFDEPWGVWEIHPHGDEWVYLLSGDTDFVLMVDGEEETIRVSTPGTYVIVPKGVWHTAKPHSPTTMLFVTPGQGTINALEPGGEPL